MKKIKTLVDREPLGSDYIASKQNFEAVCTQVKQLTPTWKTPWFYGPIGLATLAICISVATVHSSSASEKTVPTKEVLTENSAHDETSIIQKEEVNIVAETSEVTKQSPQPKQEAETSATPVAKVDEAVVSAAPVISVNEQVIDVPETIIVKRTVAKDNRFPHIAGYFTGEIPVELLFDADGIQLRDGFRIIAYDLNFYDGRANIVQSHIGNLIPAELKTTMRNYNVGSMVFITNIKAVDASGRIFVLPAINYKLVD